MDVPARQQRTWMFSLHRLPKDWFLVVQVLWTSYAWSPEYLPRADTSWRQSKLCQDSLINPCLFRETRRIWFQSFFITLSAVTQALNINANKKTPLQKERPYDDYFPLCFSSQYLQRYTSFSSSVRIKIWSSSCSIEVMHLGFLQEITFLIWRGRVRTFLSTILSPWMTLTVILWSI